MTAHVAAARDAGLSETDITLASADVVGLVSLNLLTGAFNLVAGITPEAQEAAAG